MKSSKGCVWLIAAVMVVAVVVCYYFSWYKEQAIPDCYSEVSKSQVKNLSVELLTKLSKEMTGKDLRTDIVFAVSDIREQDRNEKTDAVICAANFSVYRPDGQKQSIGIGYTIEKMEKLGEFYYTVNFLQ